MSTNIRTHTYIHSVVFLFLVLWLVYLFVLFLFCFCFLFCDLYICFALFLFFFVFLVLWLVYFFLFCFCFFLFYLSFLPSSVIAWILFISLLHCLCVVLQGLQSSKDREWPLWLRSIRSWESNLKNLQLHRNKQHLSRRKTAGTWLPQILIWPVTFWWKSLNPLYSPDGKRGLCPTRSGSSIRRLRSFMLHQFMIRKKLSCLFVVVSWSHHFVNWLRQPNGLSSAVFV